MRRIILIIILLVPFINSFSQINKLYKGSFSISTPVPTDTCGYYKGTDYLVSVTVGSTSYNLKGSTDTTTWQVSGNFLFKDFPSSVSYNDGPTGGSYNIPYNGTYSQISNYENYSAQMCDEVFSSQTLSVFRVNELDFKISPGPGSVCGYEPVTLVASIDPTSSYNWYARSGAGSWYLLRSSAVKTITFNQSELPSGLNLSQPIYFKATTNYEGFDVETAVSTSTTFYPPVPSQATIGPIRATCPENTGSVNLSAFKFADNSSYNAGSGNLYAILVPQSGDPLPPQHITSNSTTIDGLNPGQWTVILQLASGQCAVSLPSFTIQPPPPVITGTASAQAALCSSGTGSITVSSTGGTGGHQYAIDGINFQSSSLFNGVAPGKYRVTIRDANGCQGLTNEVTLTAPTPVILAVNSQNNTTGYGLANGSVSLTASGGNSSAYSYSINGGAFTSSSFFGGLPAGTYTVLAKDANSCVSNSGTFTITEPPPLTLSIISATPVSCWGNSDGLIKVNGNGGIPGYEYSLTNAFPASPVGEFNYLSAGNYTVYVKDSQGNTTSVNVSISTPQELRMTTTGTDISCRGANNGSITVSPTGGTAPYRISVDGNAYLAQTSFTGLSAGMHWITVMDANGCTSTGSITINEPPALLFSVQEKTDVTCFAGSDGSVTLVASGGNNGYQYSLSGITQSSPIFKGLAAGSYTASVRDSEGCVATVTFSVMQPPQLVLTEDESQHKDVSCFGSSDGKIVINSSGGYGRIIYRINTDLTDNLTGEFAGLTAGEHIITAIDDSGCSTFIKVTLSQPLALSFTSTVQPVNCFGNSDGSIVLNPSGGTGGYEFSIGNGSFQSGNTFSALSAGKYLIRIKDSSGCETSQEIVVPQPQVLSVTETGRTNVSCYSFADGILQVQAQGGKAPYIYAINGGQFDNVTGNFSGLPAGAYQIQVRDSRGCETEIHLTISQPSKPLVALLEGNDLTCYNSANGQIRIAASGGTLPYSYSLSGDDFQESNVFSNLVAGDYLVYVKDKNGCVFSESIKLTQPLKLQLTVQETHVICYGDASGQIEVIPTGGTLPYRFSLDGGPYQDLNTFSSLKSGTYEVTVRDASGCVTAMHVTINNLYDPISMTLASVSPITCLETGSITVTGVSGGKPPYSYSLNNKDFFQSPKFMDLNGGVYTVFVKDDAGCIVSKSSSIIVPTAVQASISTVDPTCNGASDGIIYIKDVNGANGNYSYSIDGNSFQAVPEFKNLSAGVYIVTIKDQPFSCQTSYTVEVKQPEPLTINLLGKQDLSCHNENDGSFQTKITGGTEPYSLKLNGQEISGFNFEKLSGGNYFLEVVDANGCKAELEVFIANPQVLELQLVSKKDLSCFGSSEGAIELSAAGGIPPYKFALNEGPFIPGSQFTDLLAGNYTIRVQDANGCVQAKEILLEQPAEPVSIQILTKNEPDCWGGTNGSFTFSVAGGSGNYTYRLNGKTLEDTRADGLSAGIYKLQVTDQQGCVSEVQVPVLQPEPLQVRAVSKYPQCFNDCNGEIRLEITGGTKPYEITWLSNPGLNGKVTATNLCAGTYQLLITDARNCSKQLQVTLSQPDQLVISETIRNTVLCLGQKVIMDAGNPGATYFWESDNGFRSTEQVVSLTVAGNYTFSLKASDGCQVSRRFTITTSTSLLKADFLASTFITR
ncbi:MAG TPA: hypothetical protein VGD90_13235, partial [Sphingobacteriaceae bacterium]